MDVHHRDNIMKIDKDLLNALKVVLALAYQNALSNEIDPTDETEDLALRLDCECQDAAIFTVQNFLNSLEQQKSELEVIKGLLQDTYLLVCIEDSQEYRVVSYDSDTGEIDVEFDGNEMTLMDSELTINDWIFYKLIQQEPSDTKLLKPL